MVDDSQSIGTIGENGKGILSHYNLYHKVDIITSTFSKALGGGQGGYISGNKELIHMCRRKGRTSLFSNSITPLAAGTAITAIKLL